MVVRVSQCDVVIPVEPFILCSPFFKFCRILSIGTFYLFFLGGNTGNIVVLG
jgi:hypothetical protein